MDPRPVLTARQTDLLSAVCLEYVVSGQPVSSGRLVKAHDLPWSSATVRQEFAALERAGLLRRSHHSSGRLPTRRGLELYVAPLAGSSKLAPGLADVVDRGLRAAGSSVRDEVRAASAVLSEVAGCVAVSFVGAAREGRIETVELSPLVLPRALVVLGFRDGSIAMRPVSLAGLDADPALADRQLRKLQGRLRSLCGGRTLEEALGCLRDLHREQQARIDHVLAEALRVGLIVCTEAALDPLWLEVAGQRLLAGDASSAAVRPEALGEILGLLEDYQQLAEVLCQLLPSVSPAPGDGEHAAGSARAHVRVGVPLGRPDGPAQPVRLTVVGCRLPLPQVSASTGVVALLGSDRMDYARAIPLVEYAARSLVSHGES